MTDITSRIAPVALTDEAVYEFSGAPLLDLIDDFQAFAHEVDADPSRLIEGFHCSISNFPVEHARILVNVWESSVEPW